MKMKTIGIIGYGNMGTAILQGIRQHYTVRVCELDSKRRQLIKRELHITPKDPIKMGELWFAMSDMEDIHCHVFMAHEFDGVPTATDEAIPAWTALDAIPWERMWEDDPHWLPHMLEGKKFLGKFVFEGENIQWREVLVGESSTAGWMLPC